MLEDALVLLNKHAPIALTLGLAMIAGAMLEKLRAEHARRQGQSRTPYAWPPVRKAPSPRRMQKTPADLAPAKVLDAADQLRIVMAAEFTCQPLLNRSEARVFRELDVMVLAVNPDWQMMAQVSLGEVLSSKNDVASLPADQDVVTASAQDEIISAAPACEIFASSAEQDV